MTTAALIPLILSNAVTLRRDKSILFSRTTIIVLLYSFKVACKNIYITCLDSGIGLHGGLFELSSLSISFDIFIIIISTIIVQLTAFFPRRVWTIDYASLNKIFFYKLNFYKTKIINKMGEQFKIIEYPLILLFIINGAVFLISTSDLVSIFLSIELQSYGLYILSTLYRNSELATSGGLMYFLLGGLSSCFILLGSGLLYSNSGTTSMDGLYIINNMPNIVLDWVWPDIANSSLLIISVGFLFKISASPFHFWSPDVYDAIPTIVITFVAIIAKISILVFFLELIHYTNNHSLTWTISLTVSSFLSLIIGATLGLTQFRIKRLFAYSTISHLGFILLALTIHSIESIQAFVVYLMQYSISNLNAFILLNSLGYSLYYFYNRNKRFIELPDKNNSPIQLINQIKGYFYLNPGLTLALSITLFSFIGVPPLIGFFAKQMILSSALQSGFIFLALIAILTSVISAVYYLGVIKQLFFDSPEYQISKNNLDITMTGTIIYKTNIFKFITFKHNNVILSSYLTITISCLTLLISFFIFAPQELLSIANILALILFNP